MNLFLDASKFVNDDYVLACSLENGQVLFLHNYQDQSPIHVDTELQSNEEKQQYGLKSRDCSICVRRY